jgi:integrase
VVDELRGQHKEFVFTFRGHQLTRVLNSSWKKARVRAGLPQLRVHDLRHTFSHRLRAAGVSLEDRKALLGHTNDDVTTHYSAADLNHLLECVRKIERQDRGTVLRVVGAKREQTVGEAQSSPIVASVSG